MSPAPIRSKRFLIPSLLALLVLAVGGVFWASSAAADRGAGRADQTSSGPSATIDDDRYDDDRRDDADDANDRPDADDRALSTSERTSAGTAATDAVGGGTVTDVEASDDRGVAYEAEVQMSDGTEWDVDLDSAFAVVHKSIDH